MQDNVLRETIYINSFKNLRHTSKILEHLLRNILRVYFALLCIKVVKDWAAQKFEKKKMFLNIQSQNAMMKEINSWRHHFCQIIRVYFRGKKLFIQNHLIELFAIINLFHLNSNCSFELNLFFSSVLNC